MNEPDKKTQARIPAPVHQWLTDRAKTNDRSMNAELVRILKEVMTKETTETQHA
ncbi:Arc family DNA-binding protein [Thiothrix lacustris]|uniref:Arc family DNA-binding protein n=1 Tax=Thiothrix lacustris TaxID=525917 RepID=A0ABY9MRP9_9GAMM|nr:Arc family DNA-binding protein [Thiothrix lacustris]WML91247.1 Arc family DNA-binding protein [Thiothrix lacustris]